MAFTPALVAAHEFFEALLGVGVDGRPRLPELVVPLLASPRLPILVYTDASYRRGEAEECSEAPARHIARLGFVLHDPGALDPATGRRGLTLYATAVPSHAVMASFSPDKRTYITQLEALAALAVYSAEAEWRAHGVDLRGREVNHFIDNTGALSAFVNGYARATDLARLSNMFWLLVAGMRVRPWLEYVPSLANIADLPSRDEYELLDRLGAHRVPDPTLPTAVDWQAPLEHWLERGARCFADDE